MCKECKKEYNRKWRAKNRNRVNAYARAYNSKYRIENKSKIKEYSRKYQRKRLGIDPNNFRGEQQGQYISDPKKYRALRNYDLTEEQYDNLPKYCQVCGETENLCIDHNHRTGKVRGTLCRRCNVALGYLRDNPVFIKNLLVYLEKDLEDETIQI